MYANKVSLCIEQWGKCFGIGSLDSLVKPQNCLGRRPSGSVTVSLTVCARTKSKGTRIAAFGASSEVGVSLRTLTCLTPLSTRLGLRPESGASIRGVSTSQQNDGLFEANSQHGQAHMKEAKSVMEAQDDWMTIGQFRVYPWALSGLESSIVVDYGEAGELSVVFDMGYAHREAVKCANIFISHGHHDHVAGIVHHASKRSLYGMKPATYHIPPHLVAPLTSIAENFGQMSETDIGGIRLKPISVGESVTLPGGFLVQPFPTKHRVRSQGYLVYQQTKKLKPHLQGTDPQQIGELVRQGADVFDIQKIPLLAYTGDTMFDIFLSEDNPDLLKVKLLITETTYIDDEIDRQGRAGVERARDRGHCHLQEFVDNRQLFSNIQSILFLHFSDKYSLGYIKKRVEKLLPDIMKEKVHLGLLQKEKFS